MKSYLDLAREGKNDWWRYLIGYPSIIIIWFVVGAIPVVVLAVAVSLDNDPQTNLAQSGFAGINPLLNFTVNVFNFLPFILATFMVVSLLHRRHPRTLITPASKINWGRIIAGAGVWAVLAALVAAVEALLYPGRYTFTPNLARLLPFALLAVLFLPIQTSSEEIFFRGYILQGLGLKTKNTWILCVLSGILFTLPHLVNPEVTVNAFLVPLFYFFFGAFATLVTIRDNSLELALGMHMGNNLFTTLFANYTISALASPSLFTINEFDAVYNVIAPLVQMMIFYFLFFKVWPKREEAPAAIS